MTSDHLSNKEALVNIRKRLDISLTHIPTVTPSIASIVTTTPSSAVSHKPKLSVIPPAVMMNPAWQQHAEIMKQSLSLLALQRSQQSSAGVATPVDLSPFVPVQPAIPVCGAGPSMTSANTTGSTSSPSQVRRNMNQGVPHPIPFKCPLCSLVYRTQTFLNEHMRKEHSVLI